MLIVASGLLLVIQQIKLSQDQAPQCQGSIKLPPTPRIMGSIRQVEWQEYLEVLHSFKPEEMMCSV